MTKDQSLFNISDRKELLKVVCAGQLEDYQGDELIKMLDGIDPKIRSSLTQDPPGTWTNHEKAAHALLKEFLINNKEIAFEKFLNVAKGLYSNDYSVIDFAVNDLAPEKIDDALKDQLKDLTHEGKKVEFERKLKQKIGETMLSEPEKFKDLHIPPFDLSRKGATLLAAADIDYQDYLTTGVGYHRFSVSGLESYAEASNFMRDLWKTTTVQPTGTAAEREREERELLATLELFLLLTY